MSTQAIASDKTHDNLLDKIKELENKVEINKKTTTELYRGELKIKVKTMLNLRKYNDLQCPRTTHQN